MKRGVTHLYSDEFTEQEPQSCPKIQKTGQVSYPRSFLNTLVNLGSRLFSRAPVVEPAPIEVLNSLPEEIWINILQWVPAQDLVKNIALASRKFYRLSKDDFLWKMKAEQMGIPVDDNSECSIQQQVRAFFAECQRLKSLYPPEIINAVGGEKALALLPVLPLPGPMEEYINIHPEQAKGHGLWRGEEPRPFLTICEEIGSSDAPSPRRVVVTLFRRYKNSLPRHWVRTGDGYLPMRNGLNKTLQDYLTRLIKRRPCGKIDIVTGREGDRLTDDNIPVVQLADHQGHCSRKRRRLTPDN